MKQQNNKVYKAINFDLKIKKLKQNYPGKHFNDAYDDIREYMSSHGFSHRQGSGYRSDIPLEDSDVIGILTDMAVELPWLSESAEVIDVTNIGQRYDLLSVLETVNSVKELSFIDAYR